VLLKKVIRALQVLVVFTSFALFACSQSAGNAGSTLTPAEVTSTLTNSAAVSYQGISLPLSDEQQQFGAPPPAWLVFNEQAFPARNAASETLQAHLDPAEAFPDLPSIRIPEQGEFIIIIASDSVTEFRASVVQWDPQANPLPIIETQGQLLTHTMRTENEFIIFTLTAIYPSKEQFLHVYITFSQMSSGDDVAGYAHYLWRITLDQ
jgi:hypothetical protein